MVLRFTRNTPLAIFVCLSLSIPAESLINECAKGGVAPVPICSPGFKVVADRRKSPKSVPVCEKIVYSDVQWRCIRGQVYNNSKCETLDEYPSESYCRGGDVLFGSSCYVTGSSVFGTNGMAADCRYPHFRRRGQNFKKDQNCPQDSQPFSAPASYSALRRCRDPTAELDAARQVCRSALYWDKVPVCVGTIVSIETSKDRNLPLLVSSMFNSLSNVFA